MESGNIAGQRPCASQEGWVHTPSSPPPVIAIKHRLYGSPKAPENWHAKTLYVGPIPAILLVCGLCPVTQPTLFF